MMMSMRKKTTYRNNELIVPNNMFDYFLVEIPKTYPSRNSVYSENRWTKKSTRFDWS